MPVVNVQARFLPSVEPEVGMASVLMITPVATLISSMKSGCATPDTGGDATMPFEAVPPTRSPRIVPEGANAPALVL